MGERLGSFELGDQIGAGAMGRVYRARDPRLGREVAIKVMADELRADSERMRRFEVEARAAAKVTHPNVMAIYDVGNEDGTPYLVCELLDGESLRARANAPMPWRKAIEIGIQIAAGLAAIHAAGIVHRDLKPGNLFVTRDGRVKLLDFGVARVDQPELPPGDSTVTGALIGTAGYMAPEQVRGEAADGRADIFALGVVLYELLAGTKAFGGASDVERAYAVIKSDPADLPASVPAPLVRIVRRCIEKRRDDRFESARDVGFALDALLERSGSLEHVRVPPRRSFVLPIAAACIVVSAGVVGWLIRRASSSGAEAQARPTFTPLTFQRGVVREARFAPTVGGVIYTASWEGEPATTYLALPGHAEARALYAPGSELMAISAKGDVILRVPPDDRLGRVSIAGGEPLIVAEHVVAADFIAGSDELALVRREGSHYIVEFPAGHRVLKSDNVILPIRVSRDGTRVAAVVWDNGLFDLVTVDGAGGKTVVADDWRDVNGVVWSTDGKELWFSGSPLALSNNTSAVYASDLQGHLRTLLDGPVIYKLDDIAADGRCLVGRHSQIRRAAAHRTGDTVDREVSVFDRPSVTGISDDGMTVLVLETGEAAPHGLAGASSHVRRLDGSPPVKLVDLFASSLSPDGTLALVFKPTRDPEQLMLVPLGTGARRDLPNGPVREIRETAFFPDGKQIIFLGVEAGPAARLYIQDLVGGLPRPISPPGIGFGQWSQPVSPDGHWVFATDGHGYRIYPIDGGVPRDIPNLQPDDVPLTWSSGDRVLVMRPAPGRATIHAVDLASGAWTALHEIAPPDKAGTNLGREYDGDTHPLVTVTHDGSAYGYRYTQWLSQIYLVDGVR